MDKIFLQELRVETRLGVPEWERLKPQTIMLDIEFAMPHSRACISDAIEDTIDYASVASRIRATLQTHSFQLVEALAEHVCQLMFTEFSTPWVRLRVVKPGILPGIGRLGVEIERTAPV